MYTCMSNIHVTSEQSINLPVNDRVLGINLQMSSLQPKRYIIERGRS